MNIQVLKHLNKIKGVNTFLGEGRTIQKGRGKGLMLKKNGIDHWTLSPRVSRGKQRKNGVLVDFYDALEIN